MPTADPTTIHCESPSAETRTVCGEARRSPTYPVAQFLRLCTLPQHEEFGKLCYPCITRLDDITGLAMEHKLQSGRFNRSD